MLILICIAVAALIMGGLFLADEKLLDGISQAMNKVIIQNKPLTSQARKILAVLLIIFAGVLFFVAARLPR